MDVVYPRRASLLRFLPAIYEEDRASADLLQRYLAVFEALLEEQHGSIEAVLRTFQPSRAEPEFLGWLSPGMNLFDARIDGAQAAIDGQTIELGAAFRPSGGNVQVGIRPEFIRLTDDDAGLPARITRVEDVGRHKIIRLDVNGREINAIAPEGAEIPADSTRIALDPKGINVYANDWRVSAEGEAAR